MFRGFQVELSGYPRGRHIIVEQSGHFIQEDEPELVVNTIHQMVDIVRQEFNGLRQAN
jgi:hypothetical protein